MSLISDRIVWWFRMHGGKATLREIIESRECWAYEARARFTECRKRGITIVCQIDRANPSNNLYRLMEAEQGELGLSA